MVDTVEAMLLLLPPEAGGRTTSVAPREGSYCPFVRISDSIHRTRLIEGPPQLAPGDEDRVVMEIESDAGTQLHAGAEIRLFEHDESIRRPAHGGARVPRGPSGMTPMALLPLPLVLFAACSSSSFNQTILSGEDHRFEIAMTGRGALDYSGTRRKDDVLLLAVTVSLERGDTYRCEFEAIAPVV